MEIFKKIKTNKQAKKLSGHKRCKSATILDMVVLWFPKTIRNRPISWLFQAEYHPILWYISPVTLMGFLHYINQAPYNQLYHTLKQQQENTTKKLPPSNIRKEIYYFVWIVLKNVEYYQYINITEHLHRIDSKVSKEIIII